MGKKIFLVGLATLFGLGTPGLELPAEAQRQLNPGAARSSTYTRKKGKQRTLLPAPGRRSGIPETRFSKQLQEEGAKAWTAEKFYSRTVYYLQTSSSRRPATPCDEAVQARKKLEAEIEAAAECAEWGRGSCEVTRTLIRKNGVLRCSDFPGGRCPVSGMHYYGCVAESLVLGHREDSPARLGGL